MEITEVRTREDMINNLKANGNYSKFKQNMAASRKAYSERMANYKISKSKENASDLKVEWKLIEGFDGIYSVSNYGEVRNNRTGKNNLEWVTAQENTQYSVCNRKLPGQQKKRNNKTGERNITHYNGYNVVRIYGKKYVSKSFKNIDDAKQWRDLKLKEIYD